jgi:hypothetical protein
LKPTVASGARYMLPVCVAAMVDGFGREKVALHTA